MPGGKLFFKLKNAYILAAFILKKKSLCFDIFLIILIYHYWRVYLSNFPQIVHMSIFKVVVGVLHIINSFISSTKIKIYGFDVTSFHRMKRGYVIKIEGNWGKS